MNKCRWPRLSAIPFRNWSAWSPSPIRGCRSPLLCTLSGAIPAGWISAIPGNCKRCARSCRFAARRRPAPSSTAYCCRATRMRPAIRRIAASRWVRCAMPHRMKSKWRSTPAPRLSRNGTISAAMRAEFHQLLVREAGKTFSDAIAEVREAVDFCRYYALRARKQFAAPLKLEGPTGELNELSLQGRGVFTCISPWNFPLAIFAGQVTAALAAGNAVVAKPAEPTPLIAARFVKLLHEAGIHPEALQLVPARGRLFGEIAFAHPALAGVAMTGSTATALTINRALAGRGGAIVPLIAETGGLNAMIADSTALPEQIVDDVVSSAFMSAGQRCSALRLLFLQEEIAEQVLEMIAGAMDELIIGDPSRLETDIGPVITAAAAQGLAQHVERMRKEARIVKVCELGAVHAHGSFFAPHLIELKNASQLTREEFGPILHVVRYRSTGTREVLQAIRASHYGLTLGVQTRLESFWRQVFKETEIGNTYVNRNMIGAVVGVQPFGGTGLSGTGPKAGGPHYLSRFANERTLTVNTTATGGNAALLNLGG